MSDDRLVGIGAFSVLSGLSIAVLRDYAELGLLSPALVDNSTRYRRYALSQVGQARRVKALRAIGLPLRDIRLVVDGDDSAARTILRHHRDRLTADLTLVAAQLELVDSFIENGVTMSPTTACRVVEVNVGVDDVEKAADFYTAAFGVEIVRDDHGDGASHLMAIFGSWPSDEFFLLNIHDGSQYPERRGRADFGFLVDDVDAVHARALAAGATEVHPPTDHTGMPRGSTVLDPGGNLVNLYQNVSSDG